jgi:uncharacterized protein YqiB (DUF1249 family)
LRGDSDGSKFLILRMRAFLCSSTRILFNVNCLTHLGGFLHDAVENRFICWALFIQLDGTQMVVGTPAKLWKRLVGSPLGTVSGQGAEHEASLRPSDVKRQSGARDALAAATAISDEIARANALSWLAPHLTGTLLHDALAAATAISDEIARARALVALAPHLPETLRDALAAVTAIPDGIARADTLAALAPHLTETLLRDALAAATAISEEYPRSIALGRLARYLTETLLRDALAAATAISGDLPRAQAFGLLAPHLTETLLHEALVAATASSGDIARATALAALAPHLTETLLHDALATATAISEDGYFRGRALTELRAALARATAIPNEHAYARASRPVVIRRVPPDEESFAIVLNYKGPPDRLRAEQSLCSALRRKAKAVSVECETEGCQQCSTMGDYIGQLVAFASTPALIAILIKSAKDILVKWLDTQKRDISISLPGGLRLTVRSTKQLGEVLAFLDKSAFIKEESRPQLRAVKASPEEQRKRKPAVGKP